jgi:hypothetical protein
VEFLTTLPHASCRTVRRDPRWALATVGSGADQVRASVGCVTRDQRSPVSTGRCTRETEIRGGRCGGEFTMSHGSA